MPASLISRLPTGRRTEVLLKLSANSKRLRGRYAPNANFTAAQKGRQDTLQAMLNRGIIPIHVMDGAVTLHAWVQGYPGARASADTVTVTSTNGPYSKAFAYPSNADDATLAATGVTDFAATDSIDAAATGAARATIT